MLRLGVLGNSDSWYVADLQRVARSRGSLCDRLEFPHLIGAAGGQWPTSRHGDVDLLSYDAVIVRTMPPGSLEQVVFRMDLLHQLVDARVLVLNSPRSLECAVDKYLTTARMARAGLPVPETIVCEGFEEAIENARAAAAEEGLFRSFGELAGAPGHDGDEDE